MVPSLSIDLRRPAHERWDGLAPHAPGARALIDALLRELGGAGLAPLVRGHRDAFVSQEYQAEVDAVARLVGRAPDEVLLANVYYDALRAMMGCTAFAVDRADGPIHARNLDWSSEQHLLEDLTMVVSFEGGPRGAVRSVGWPGFVGAFSGIAPGRFAVTMNAVIGRDRPGLGVSIALLIRSVLEAAASYDEAVRLFAETPIASDCLLLVTGARRGELVVVERTTGRCALRGPERGRLVVTNDYRTLDAGFAAPGELAATACARFDRASQLLEAAPIVDVSAAMRVLSDAEVKMPITVQHMVMHAATGQLDVHLPSPAVARVARKALRGL